MEEKQMTLEPRDFTFDMSGLRLAFFGLLLTVINIRIQGFDIVPDIIGYIMVIVGLGRIEHYEANFTAAKKISYVLAVLALVNIYQAPAQNTINQGGTMVSSNVSFNAGVFGSSPVIALLLMLMGMAANLYFAYCMCMGMKNLLNQVGDTVLSEICEQRWKLILAAQIGMAASFFLALLQIPFAVVLTLLFAAFTLVVMVLFLLLIHHSYQSIHGKGKVL